MNSFDKVFRPEKQWADICLTDACPCDDCVTGKHIREKAIYGSVAERGYIEMPKECETCIQWHRWKIACMQKLAWYERNDERLNKKRRK